MSPLTHRNAFSKHPFPTPYHTLGDLRTLLCAKERDKAWVLPLYKYFLSTYNMLGSGAGTEKGLLPWKNSPIKFLNLSKGLFKPTI